MLTTTKTLPEMTPAEKAQYWLEVARVAAANGDALAVAEAFRHSKLYSGLTDLLARSEDR